MNKSISLDARLDRARNGKSPLEGTLKHHSMDLRSSDVTRLLNELECSALLHPVQITNPIQYIDDLDVGREEHLSPSVSCCVQAIRMRKRTIRAEAPKEWAGRLERNLERTTPELPWTRVTRLRDVSLIAEGLGQSG